MNGIADEDLWRYFAPDYVTARQRFLDSCEAASAIVDSYPIRIRGPYDENLHLDIAYLGSESPSRLLIHTSGVHGVEGYPGSAAQVRMFERLAQGDLQIPADCGILVAHAINPYGFAWLRRVNEDNADLNRNFLAPGEAYVGEPELYRRLDGLLNPRSHKSVFDLFSLKAAYVMARHGFNKVKQAIAEGQYERPKALQFGGNRLAESPKAWLDHLAKVLPSVEQVVWIDFHTGLGPFGVDSLLVSGDDSPEQMSRLTAHYGDTIQPNDPDAGVAYRIRGGMMDGVRARWPGIDWTLLTQEFGTYKPTKVIAALRAENRMTQWSGLDERSKLHSRERKNLLETFSPASNKWRSMVMKRGQALVDDALLELGGTSED